MEGHEGRTIQVTCQSTIVNARHSIENRKGILIKKESNCFSKNTVNRVYLDVPGEHVQGFFSPILTEDLPQKSITFL